MEDSRIDRLSSAYENLTGAPDLELKVLTLNVNRGHNLDLMKQCKVLEEYSLYVDRIRTYVPDMGLDAAVHRAVEECIKENILADFLRQNRAEVEKVSIFEYDKEDEERKLRIAEYEHGRNAGIKVGRREGRREGRRQGKQEGEQQKAKETTISLAEMGLPTDKIALAVKTSVDTVQKWINENACAVR